MTKLSEVVLANKQNREELAKSNFTQALTYSFEDFCSDRIGDSEHPQGRRFVQYYPHIPGGGLNPLFTVPEQVSQALGAGLNNQRTLTEESENEQGKKRAHYTISAIDLPTLNGVDLIGRGGKFDDQKIYGAIEQFFFIPNTSKTDPQYETKVIGRLNSCLNYSLYAYNYIYYRNVPSDLKKFYFETFDDVKEFLKKTMRDGVFRHVYCEILKHMLCFNYALHKKPVAKGHQYLSKLESQLSQDFVPTSKEQENGTSTGYFDIPIRDEIRRVTFRKRSRAKGIFSSEQKLLGNPREDDESIFNDTLGIEYIFSSKEDILLFLYILYEKHISPNRTSFIKQVHIPGINDKASILQGLIEGRDFRQKGMFTEEDIESFVEKYRTDITDGYIYLLRNLDMVKKVGTSEGYQDIKFQGKYNFGSSLGINTMEIRCILEENENESGMGHSAIRKGIKTILAQIRKGYYVTESYVYRVAYISHLKSGGEVSVEEIFESYKKELIPFAYTNERGKEIPVGGLYSAKTHAERLKKHGFNVVGIKNYNGTDLK